MRYQVLLDRHGEIVAWTHAAESSDSQPTVMLDAGESGRIAHVDLDLEPRGLSATALAEELTRAIARVHQRPAHRGPPKISPSPSRPGGVRPWGR